MPTPSHERERRDAADRLNRFWDAATAARRGVGDGVHPGGAGADAGSNRGSNPGSDRGSDRGPDVGSTAGFVLGEAVRRLHLRDDAPPPDPAFALRLWGDLVASAAAAGAAASVSSRSGSRTVAFLHPGARRSVLELVAAVLLLAVLGGGFGGVLFPGLPGFGSGSPTVAAHNPPVTATTTTTTTTTATSTTTEIPRPGAPCSASPTPAATFAPSGWGFATPEGDDCG